MTASAVRSRAAAVAATGLPPRSPAEAVTAPDPVPDGVWPGLLSVLADQGLTGLAVAAVQAGTLPLENGQLDDLLDRHQLAMALTLELERALLEVWEAFDAAGIEAVVLKGAGTAHHAYPDPALRPFRDVDVLVRTSQWRDACRVLARLGYQRVRPEPRAGFDERFGKAATHRGPDGLWVDLHRTLVLGPFGLWLEPDGLFAHTAPFELAGTVLRRLDTTVLLLHACLHATLGNWPPRLLPLRDVAQLAVRNDVDWVLLARLTRQWRLTAPVADGLRAAARTLQMTVPTAARPLLDHTPRRWERRALAAYHSRQPGRLGVALATLQAIPGIRPRLAYLRSLLAPDADFLETRTGGAGAAAYLRRWAVPLRWLAAGLRRVARRLLSRMRP